MANNRRGGYGYDDGYDSDYSDDEEVDATRAMDVVDDLIAPTEMVRSSAPPPPPPRGRGAPPPPPSYEDDEEDATRMIDAMDMGRGGPPPPPPAPREPLVELRVVSGPDRGKVHTVLSGDHLVGRGLDCGIVLADPAVSRKHFRVVRHGDTVEAIDMGGANGTNVNGDRISRHRLSTGDQIEVGTTVLEVHVEGAPVRVGATSGRFMDEMQAAGAGAPQPQKKSNLLIILALAAVGLVVLVGGGLTAWLVIGGDDKPSAGEVVDDGAQGDDLLKLLKQAKEAIDDREWADAVDKLKAARAIKKDDPEVRGLLSKAQDELDASESIDDGRDLVRKGDFTAAFARFGEVPQTSEQYAEARDELAAAQEKFSAARLKAAKEAVAAGKQPEAIAALKAILKVDEKNSEAKLLLEQVEAGETGEAGKDDPAKLEEDKDKDKDKAEEKADSKPRAAKGGDASALFAQALKAYHNRQWSAATSALTSIVEGSYSKADKEKAADQSAAVQEVSASMSFAETATSPFKKARAFQKAYSADRRMDGHFGPVLVRGLTDAYVAAGQASFKARRFGKAADAVREAMNFDPENKAAMDLEEKCIQAAAKMLAQAKEHMAKKNYATARDLARQVSVILPALDPGAAEAREIAKKATEASVAGDDED